MYCLVQSSFGHNYVSYDFVRSKREYCQNCSLLWLHNHLSSSQVWSTRQIMLYVTEFTHCD